MRIDNATQIVDATMIDTSTGKEIKLFEEQDSKCHFYRFNYKDKLIQFRLDWGDIKNGEPTLDVDIYTVYGKTKTKYQKDKKKWHHNEKIFDEKNGNNIYFFEFESLKIKLTTRITACKDIRCDIRCKKPEKK